LGKLRIGLIGCGAIAKGKHLPGWAGVPNVEVVASCDIVEERNIEAREQFGIKRTFADYNEMLSSCQLDAVDICTPNDVHMPAAIAALRAGRHVLVEKPIGRNAEEAARMVEAARDAGCKLMVAQCQRFRGDAGVLKRYIEAGELGEIFYARVQTLRRRGVPSWGVFIDKEKQGGGPLIDIGVHMLDLALWFMGHPKPTAVSGVTYEGLGKREGTFGVWGPWDYKNYTVEDFAAGLVRFENGATLVIESSFIANIEKDIFDCALLGTEGGAAFSPLKIFKEKHGALLDVSPVNLPQVDAFRAELTAFAQSVRDDTEPPVPGEQGLLMMKIIDGIYQSAKLGREVHIDQ